MISCNLQHLQKQVHPQQKTFSQVFFINFIFLLNHAFHLEQPFTQTSSNDANWGAFVETTKHPTTMITNISLTSTMSMPTNAFAHPPPEPVRFFLFNLNLFSMKCLG
jgi:hypothetical protein